MKQNPCRLAPGGRAEFERLNARSRAEASEMLLAMSAFSWHPRFKVLTRDQVDLLHAAGLKVFPWTINTRKEARKLLDMGVDGIICNDLQVLGAPRPR